MHDNDGFRVVALCHNNRFLLSILQYLSSREISGLLVSDMDELPSEGSDRKSSTMSKISLGNI